MAHSDAREKRRSTCAEWPRCYSSLDSHCELVTLDGETRLAKYEVQWLTTMRVFGAVTGTVFESPLLWSECVMVALVYMTVFATMKYFHFEGFGGIVGTDANIRAFLGMFSTFIGLLLSFYMALVVSRWWSMRVTGIEGISQSCDRLILLLSESVTRNEEILHAARRYADASLLLFFIRNETRERQLAILQEKDLLTQDEAAKLGAIGYPKCWSEAIWVWLANIVTRCYAAGLTAGDPHYVSLITAVDKGRRGAGHIRLFYETAMPMGYVHLLGLMVKLHNVLLCFFMALMGVKHLGRDDPIAFTRTMLRAFFMPLLYNSLLILADQLVDPFGADPTDFPYVILKSKLVCDTEGIISGGSNLPKWMCDLKLEKPKVAGP